MDTQVFTDMAYVNELLGVNTKDGVKIPVDEVIGLFVPVTPVAKVPPIGLTMIGYCAEVLHKGGRIEIVGVGGFTAVTEMVFTIGQLIKLGVTTTV